MPLRAIPSQQVLELADLRRVDAVEIVPLVRTDRAFVLPRIGGLRRNASKGLEPKKFRNAPECRVGYRLQLLAAQDQRLVDGEVAP